MREPLRIRLTRRLRPLAVIGADLRERWFGRTPELTQPDRVVFVCRGNVCRSVFAEHLMRRRYPEVEVVSVGVHVDVSVPPPLQAVEAGRAFGLDLSTHRSRSILSIEDSSQILYLVFEPWHARESPLRGPAAEGRVFHLGVWAVPRRAVIDDPYGGGPEAFRRCFRIVGRSIDNLARSWIRPEE